MLWVVTSNGVYKTTNGGTNWVNTQSGDFRDLKVNPSDPNIIYATTNSQFFRSSDAGDSFTQITIGLPTTSIDDLTGKWNVKELYYLNLENDITATFQIPECAREFSYHAFTSDGSITNQGIGINWPLNKCTSDPFNINNSQITISSNGNQIVHYINNIKRTWVILDKPDEDTLILESFRNDASDNYNGNDVGFKLVRDIPNVKKMVGFNT